MGNSNSGRTGGKARCEQCPNLDIRRLARQKLLITGKAFIWRWSSGDAIEVNAHHKRLELRYAIAGKPTQSYWLTLSETTCHFGGVRDWFNCPCCGKQVAKLFLRHSRFACRTCQRLRYHSQSLDPMARTQWAYGKLQNRLRDNELKPKGMHWRTYERITARMVQLDEQVNARFLQMAARLNARYNR